MQPSFASRLVGRTTLSSRREDWLMNAKYYERGDWVWRLGSKILPESEPTTIMRRIEVHLIHFSRGAGEQGRGRRQPRREPRLTSGTSSVHRLDFLDFGQLAPDPSVESRYSS
jgi:hypothetical protein